MTDPHETITEDMMQPKPLALFAEVARENLRTPTDLRERDVGQVMTSLVDGLGAKEWPSHSEFLKAQADVGDQISRSADPVQRAELRTQREAAMQSYIGDLSYIVADIAEAGGQKEEASAARFHGDTRKEIAAALTGDHTPPDRGVPAPDHKAEFADAAKAAGREVLGHSAEVVMTADGPQRPEERSSAVEEVRSRAGGHDYSALSAASSEPLRPEERRKEANLTQNIAVQVVPTPAGSMTITGPQNRFQPEQAGQGRAGDLSPAIVGRVDDATAARDRDDSSKRQAGEEGARYAPTGNSRDAMRHLSDRLDTAAKAIEREAGNDKELENDGPERPTRETAATAFRSFGR